MARWGWMVAMLALAIPVLSPAAEKLPPGVTLPKDVKAPNPTVLGVYIPANVHKARVYWPDLSLWLEPGPATEAGMAAGLGAYFPGSFQAGVAEERAFGLLLDLHPQLTTKQGDVTVTVQYRVFDGRGENVLEGKQVGEAAMGDLHTSSGTREAAAKAAQLIAIDILTKLKPDTDRYPSAATMRSVSLTNLVDHEKPVATGTGFYINPAGQVMTAAHVVNDCALVEVKRDSDTWVGTTVASSGLVDLAVLDTGKAVDKFLPLRADHKLVLGEPIVNVGYPLQSILAASPNLTRGNISSESALEGSLGQFQFSAPIQPGSSGGPVVSDRGELLGVTQSTLNVARLAERGVVPQNVNFALGARYVAMFLKKHAISFSEASGTGAGTSQTGNDAALAAVLRLSCYQ